MVAAALFSEPVLALGFVDSEPGSLSLVGDVWPEGVVDEKRAVGVGEGKDSEGKYEL